MPSRFSTTRTPDCHFAAEARHNGTKMYVLSPDFNQVAKYADEWIAVNAGQDGAWWMAVNHVILSEWHPAKKTPYFLDYAKRFTDAPCLVQLTPDGDACDAGRLLRAGRLDRYKDVENGEWKFLFWDAGENRPKMPMGSVGFRWGSERGKWNLKPLDGLDGSAIDPVLTFLGACDETVTDRFNDYGAGGVVKRQVTARRRVGTKSALPARRKLSTCPSITISSTCATPPPRSAPCSERWDTTMWLPSRLVIPCTAFMKN